MTDALSYKCTAPSRFLGATTRFYTCSIAAQGPGGPGRPLLRIRSAPTTRERVVDGRCERQVGMAELRDGPRVISPRSVAPRLPGTRADASQDPAPSDLRNNHDALDAFDALIKRHEDAIFRHAYHLAGNYDDAGDITAETFVRMYRSLGDLRHSAALSSWIDRIVNRVYIDHCRSVSARRTESLDPADPRYGYARFAAPTSAAASPQAQVEAHERAQVLNRAVNSLPSRDRSFITQFYYVGRTYDEIAASMRIPVGTVKSGLSRARAALGKRLAPERAVFID